MPYSRNSPMPESGDVPRITGLNAFGQPFRGRKIGGVKVRHSLSGSGGTGPLASRRYNSQEAAEQAVINGEQQAQAAARERGRQRAMQESGTASKVITDAPAKRPGQLIASASGASRWATGDELDRQDAQKKKATALARKRARETKDYTPRQAPPTYAPMDRVA